LVGDLSLDRGEGNVLEGVSFELSPGETLSAVGSSGSGKTSLLNAVFGLAPETVSGGFVRIEPPSAKKAMVPQDSGLFPWKTARRNLELPLLLAGETREKRRAAADAMLGELGLAGLGDRLPRELSGGERQRIALGRALIAGADLILLDEPFSSLDSLTREKLQDFLSELLRSRRPTLILATHDVEEAVFLGDGVLVLGGSPARPVRLVRNPRGKERDPGRGETFFRLVREVREALAEAGARKAP
jgi:NitT/TauT family transport system ATP-binding protein